MKKPDKIQQLNDNLAAVSPIGDKPKNPARLEKHETTIERRLHTRAGCEFDIGKELIAIREEKDYPEETFEDYIERKFGFTRSYGYRLIEAHKVQDALPEGAVTLLQNEGQARALKAAPEGKRARILKAVAKEGPVTAAAITQKVEELTGEKEVVLEAEFTEIDKLGGSIPKKLQPEWDRANGEADAVLGPLKQARKIMDEKIQNDKAWAEVANTENTKIRAVVSEVERVRPYAVCPVCKGVGTGCKPCSRRGFVSKFLYTILTKSDGSEKKTDKKAVKK